MGTCSWGSELWPSTDSQAPQSGGNKVRHVVACKTQNQPSTLLERVIPVLPVDDFVADYTRPIIESWRADRPDDKSTIDLSADKDVTIQPLAPEFQRQTVDYQPQIAQTGL